ncbi:hypothetical protein WJX77_000737 [Trebouxia sp. C0004]
MMMSTGQTALHIVLDNMSPDQQMLDLLLRHGASPYNPDKDGLKPSQFGRTGGVLSYPDGTVPGSTVGLELAKTQSSKPDGFVAAGCLLSGWTIFVGLLSTAGNKDWRQCDALAHFMAPSHLHLQPQAQVSTQA